MTANAAFACRCLGECLYGEPLDSEIGDLVGAAPGPKWFSYVRYNRSFRGTEAEQLLATSANVTRLDSVRAIPHLREIGQAYAREHVRLEHLL